MSANLENSVVATGLEKVSFRSNLKVGQYWSVQTTARLHSFSMLVRWWSKPFKRGFNATCTKNFQMYKVGLEKAEGPEIKLPISTESQEKQENSRKTSTFASLTILKPLTVWTTIFHKLWKILRDGNIWPSYLSPEKPTSGSEATVESYMEQLTGSKLGKEYSKIVYCHPAYLT